MRILLVLLMLGIASSVWAADKCWPQGGGTYTLNSVNYTPDANGIDVRGYDQYLTANFIKSAGTISTQVEVKLDSGDWVALSGGPLSANFHGSLNPSQAVIQRVRFNTGTCTGCTASLKVCGRPNAQ